jgi:hypothetical protein
MEFRNKKNKKKGHGLNPGGGPLAPLRAAARALDDPLAHTARVRPLPRWARENRGPAGFQPSGPVLLAPVPSSSGASMATAGSEAAGDEAPHCDLGTLPARVGGDGTVQVELGRCGGLASGQRSSAVASDGEARRAGVLVRRRGSGDGKARRAEVLVHRCGSGDGKAWRRRCSYGGAAATTRSDVLGQRGVASSDRGARGGRCRAGAGEAVGRRVARARRSLSGRRGEASAVGRARQLSGRAARCPDSGFKPRHRHGAWRPCGSGALPHGPSAVRDV